MNKIVRSVCLFRKKLLGSELDLINQVCAKLSSYGYLIQTKRICVPEKFGKIEKLVSDPEVLLSVGTVKFEEAKERLGEFLQSKDNFNVELADTELTTEHVDLLFRIIKVAAKKTFNFTYVFNNSGSSPFMPSATYLKDGFAVGLQLTDLAEDAESLDEWFEKIRRVLVEVESLFKKERDFLGIDSSVAPLFEGKSSLVHAIKRINKSGFEQSFTTNIYTKISSFIRNSNPKPVGLSGIMLPCLEDFELAREYEKGNFPIERNIFVSLHSGLGIDTYPIGIDEDRDRVLEVLGLVQALSNKYNKPLSVRFVSDGKAKIGEKTSFCNQYLYDVVVRKL